MDRGAWWATIHGVAKSWTRLSDFCARDGVSREVPCSALKGETVPDSLPATPKSPPTLMSMDFITWVEKIMRIKTETLWLG